MYAFGVSVPKDDAEAVQWLGKAGEQGHALSHQFLGQCYLQGVFPKNDAEAVKWYRRAAGQGDTLSQMILSNLYLDGRGVPEDKVESLAWVAVAASNGNDLARYLLPKAKNTLTAEQLASAEKRIEELRTLIVAAGIGASLRSDGKSFFIESIIADGPASKDGQLKVGDHITAVAEESGDFVDLDGMMLNEVVGLVRGETGSKVRLRVAKDGISGSVIYELTRDLIPSEQETSGSATEVSNDKLTAYVASVATGLPAGILSQLPAAVLSQLPGSALRRLPTASWPVQINSIGMKFKLLPGGTFKMGAGNDAHLVTLTRPFECGVYEVTQEQYLKVMGTNPSNRGMGIRQSPVQYLSWHDAVEFCRKLSDLPSEQSVGYVYRLPTEAEWEYACRAGTTTKYSCGDSDVQLGDYAWYEKNSGDDVHVVGQKKPNPWGLYDMHGNVHEWCQDWFGDYPGSAATDPTGAASGSHRVYRGECWESFSGSSGGSGERRWREPDDRYYTIGFRVVRSRVK